MIELWDIYDINRNKSGRFHERSKPMKTDDYHLVVNVWIINSKGEFLISKRDSIVANGMWQATGGAAVAGDDSLTTALKEVQEELGIKLDALSGFLFKQYRFSHISFAGNAHCDMWLFRQDIDISSVVLQPGETCDAMWASKEIIKHMIDENSFMSEWYPYLDELFEYCVENLK